MKTTKAVFGILAITLGLAVQIQAQTFLTNGLVAYYPFNGNAKDASGNGNDGTVYGAVLANDRFGVPESAFHFNGTNAYIDCGTNSVLRFTNALTLAAWVNISGPGSANYYGQSGVGTVINKEGEYQLLYANGELLWFFANQDPGWLGVGGQYVPGVLPTNVWQHVVVTYTNGIVITYLNGARTNAYDGCCAIGDVYPELNNLWIGGRQQEPDYFNGSIDDIRLYNRALSTNEVQQLYAYESQPMVSLKKAVKPSFSNLFLGTNYQLQVSTDLSTWTNNGSIFTPTNSVMDYPQYFDVDNWGQLFFRLQTTP
jgi:hypothetical protein